MSKLSATSWSVALVLLSFLALYLGFSDFIIKHISEIGINAIGAYLGFISAAIIYLMQLDNERSKTERDTLEKNKEHLRYFMGVMEDVVSYAKGQSDSLDKIVESIEKQPSSIHQLAFVASDAIGRLNRADNEATFHAYNMLFTQDAKREENYRMILSQSDFLVAQLAATKQIFIDYRDALYNRQLKLKDTIQIIVDETAFLLNELKQTAPAYTFGKYAPAAPGELNDILIRYISLNARLVPFEEYFKEFIEPLKSWLLNNEKFIPLEHSSYQRRENLVKLTKGASVALTDLVSNARDFIPAFDAKKLRDSSGKIEGLITSLKQVAIA